MSLHSIHSLQTIRKDLDSNFTATGGHESSGQPGNYRKNTQNSFNINYINNNSNVKPPVSNLAKVFG